MLFCGLYPTSCAECTILTEIFWQINGRKVIDFDGIFAIIQTETVKTIQTQAKTCNRRDEDVGRGAAFPHHEAAEPAAHRDGAGALRGAGRQRVHHPPRFERAGQDGQGEQGTRRRDPAGQPVPRRRADDGTQRKRWPSSRKSASQRRRRPSSPQRISSFWTQAAPRWRWSGS